MKTHANLSREVVTVLAASLLFTPFLHAVEPPGILNHQGRIVVSGTNYHGQGYFKFALVDAAGTTTLWSNDNSSTGGNEPTASVETMVSQGHYALGLGDTMTEIPASVFANHADVRLRVWFSSDNSTFEQLSPDRRITSTGYALTAGALADPSFVGTTTTAPLEFKVNNQRGLRLEYADDGPNESVNVIGGFSGNSVGAGVVGATIAGGGVDYDIFDLNQVTEDFGTVGGGFGNTASGFGATVAGGTDNTASGSRSVVSGGFLNTASGGFSTVPGGHDNDATGDFSFAAGIGAQALHGGAFVWADSDGASGFVAPFASTAIDQFLIRASGGVGIGTGNPQGILHILGATGASSSDGAAAEPGRDVIVETGDGGAGASGSGLAGENGGSIRLEAGNGGADGVFPGNGGDVMIQAGNGGGGGGTVSGNLGGNIVLIPGTGAGGNGNVGIRTTAPGAPLHVNGSGFFGLDSGGLASGAGKGVRIFVDGGAGNKGRVFAYDYTNLATLDLEVGVVGSTTTIQGTVLTPSDRGIKDDFAAVDAGAILDRLVELPLSTWKYKASAARRHVGPMAQDFHAAFDDLLNLNSDDKTIAPMDETGVTFASIQALHEKVEAAEADATERIGELEKENRELRERLERLEKALNDRSQDAVNRL